MDGRVGERRDRRDDVDIRGAPAFASFRTPRRRKSGGMESVVGDGAVHHRLWIPCPAAEAWWGMPKLQAAMAGIARTDEPVTPSPGSGATPAA